MASYVLDEFLGAGRLKDMGRKFAAGGWDDVPTLKLIRAEDMEALDLTDTQREALELRIYLHNRSLMKYADRMEASRIGLINLMSMKPSELASKFKMRKTHVATFVDTALAYDIQMPPDLSRKSSAKGRSSTDFRFSEDARVVPYFELVKQRPLYKPPPFELHRSTLSDASSLGSPPRSPPRKSSAGEWGFKRFYAKNSPPRKSNAGEPPRKSNAGEWGSRNFHATNSPPRKSNAGEPPRMSNVVEPPRKSNAGVPPRMSNVVEPPRKSNAGEWGSGNFQAKYSPPRKSNAGEPPRMSNAGVPPRKSNAGEWGSGNFQAKYSPPRKSNAGEPPRKSNAGVSPRKSNAGEWGSGNFRVKNLPPRKSNAGEPPRMSNVVEPPRKSSAGEWGSGNFRVKDSPPRKSSAGELGFRNFYAKNSPPRKSDAGFYEYACARSSPPRLSNVEELGFNGNPFARNSPPRKSNAGDFGFTGNSVARNSPPRKSNAGQLGFEQPSWVRPADATKPNALKGVFSATSTKRQLCGMVKAPSSDKVAKIALLEKVLVRQLAPEHSYGVDSRTLRGSRKLQSFKASNLWADKATLFFCIRRPGCVMCRAEAHQLFARKPIFDVLGIQLVAVLLEDIDEEVWAFWPRYWAGMVVLDEKRDFFRALGGGKLMKDNLFTGFFLNSVARLNWKRAMKTGIQYNTRGEGQIKGGMFIVRPGKGGVAYQFAEKNFGDWAPLDEVLQVCHIIRDEGDCDGY